MAELSTAQIDDIEERITSAEQRIQKLYLDYQSLKSRLDRLEVDMGRRAEEFHDHDYASSNHTHPFG